MTTQSGPKLKLYLPWILLFGGLVSIIASAALTIDYIHLLQNPSYRPVCNLNPIFSCSLVTASRQAHAFGTPNEILGLAGYAAVATIGAACLAGAQFKKWFWQLTNLGLVFAIGFLTWLQFQTLYRIGALCLFCMIVWAVSIPVFWYTTLYNLQQKNFGLPANLERLRGFVIRHHADILVAWYLIIIGLILKRFWYYWSTLL